MVNRAEILPLRGAVDDLVRTVGEAACQFWLLLGFLPGQTKDLGRRVTYETATELVSNVLGEAWAKVVLVGPGTELPFRSTTLGLIRESWLDVLGQDPDRLIETELLQTFLDLVCEQSARVEGAMDALITEVGVSDFDIEEGRTLDAFRSGGDISESEYRSWTTDPAFLELDAVCRADGDFRELLGPTPTVSLDDDINADLQVIIAEAATVPPEENFPDRCGDPG